MNCILDIYMEKETLRSNRNGFTLIELSIVIVIIGLIVAGVVGGQALVKQAKLPSLKNIKWP